MADEYYGDVENPDTPSLLPISEKGKFLRMLPNYTTAISQGAPSTPREHHIGSTVRGDIIMATPEQSGMESFFGSGSPYPNATPSSQ